MIDRTNPADIAIIGMALRLPGAENLEKYWDMLCEGRAGTKYFTDEELKSAGLTQKDIDSPNYVKAFGIVDGIENFDAPFFGYNPREAQIMDPQHRIFLEICWHTIEHAGYNPDSLDQTVGVFSGRGTNAYRILNLNSNEDTLRPDESFQSVIGNDPDYLSTRVAYKLNLRGPAITVQTACSTSLVAAHLACQSLLNGECDMAIAGGISISNTLKQGYFYFEGGAVSPDGLSRAFDESAKGFGPADGAAAVMLKPLEGAIRDGDTVYAVIKGSAINNDGSEKIGYTAPGVSGQTRVILDSQRMAGIHPDDITYVETHGTGTPLGDPIEIKSLTRAFRQQTGRTGYCAIGSVKTNIGHTIAAAGAAGLIKTALSLRHKTLFPNLYFDNPNPEIDFENTPFFVNTHLRKWENGEKPRAAGVSSFGIGGTNAHMVIQEYKPPARTRQKIDQERHLLPISHRSPEGVAKTGELIGASLAGRDIFQLADISYTLSTGRKSHAYRSFLIAKEPNEAARALKQLPPAQRIASRLHLALLFPGQGSQYTGMGRGLFDEDKTFRRILQEGAERLSTKLDVGLLDLLYPKDPGEASSDRLARTEYAQPAIFLVSYAVAMLLEARGLHPKAMIGHSIGEYVAAVLAGVFSFEEALDLVALRGKLMGSMPAGSMLAVQMPETSVRRLLPRALDLAVINGPADCVVSGSHQAVDAFEAYLNANNHPSRRLKVSHAFHSEMMEPIMEQFQEAVAAVSLNEPALPFVSNVSGTWISAAQAADPAYWANQIRQTVRFADGLSLLAADGFTVVESGPGTALTTLAKRSSDIHAIATMRHPRQNKPDSEAFLQAVGKLWVRGFDIEWPAPSDSGPPRRVGLPGYPFAPNRYWIERRPAAKTQKFTAEKLTDLNDWLYAPSWKRMHASLFKPSMVMESSSWMIFGKTGSMADQIARRLEQLGRGVISVQPGSNYSLENGNARLNPFAQDHFDRLFDSAGETISHIVFGWDFEDHEAAFSALISIAKSAGTYLANQDVRFAILTEGLYDILGTELLAPNNALSIGPLKVIPYEFENITTLGIDLDPREVEDDQAKLVDPVLAEILNEEKVYHTRRVLALRQGRRWMQHFDRVSMPDKKDGKTFRQNGTFLITGGLGGIGLVLAEKMAEGTNANLILTGRSPLPGRGQWESWLASHPEDDSISRKILSVRNLEAGGAIVRLAAVNVSDKEAMHKVISDAEVEFGKINGVIHAAGVLADAIIQFKTMEEARSVFESKIGGTLVLADLLQDHSLDFFVLCSSISSAFGGFGQVDYVSANAFMNAFAAWNEKKGQKTTSMYWDSWREVGMAANTVLPEALQVRWGNILSMAIDNDEGKEVFERLAQGPYNNVIVSAQDFGLRYEHNAELLASMPDEDGRTGEREQVELNRQDISTAFAAPETETQEMVAKVWQQLFGIQEIGIDDDFFELGGHSLLATQLLNTLRNEAGAKSLSLTQIFNTPTIAGIADTIETQAVGSDEGDLLTAEQEAGIPETVEEIGDISALSDEQVDALLRKLTENND